MLRKIIKSLGRGVAFVAAAATFVASLTAYPFILVLFLGYSLYDTWTNFFALLKEELQKTVIPPFTNRVFGIFSSMLQENSAPYEPAKVVKNFLQSVAISLILPFIALYKSAQPTFLFAIKNADEVYSSISRFMDFDGGYPYASPRDFPLPVTPVKKINRYQETKQPTMLNEHKPKSSGFQDVKTEALPNSTNDFSLKID